MWNINIPGKIHLLRQTEINESQLLHFHQWRVETCSSEKNRFVINQENKKTEIT